MNKNNEVFEFLEELIPDTPEMCLIERQELFRVGLTQAMRSLRKKLGVTQKELAQRLGVTQSWVSKLESANNDHTFESVLAYLDALGADFNVSILLGDRVVETIAARLRLSTQEIDRAIKTVLDKKEEIEASAPINRPVFDLVSPEVREKCDRAQAIVAKKGFWDSAA
ncbi:MAG: helix-turn-helix domain-containing protein [Cyanobacteria bacterium P01_E01_bin.42]